MQRRGRTAAGTQRWFCRGCRVSTIRERPDTRQRHQEKLRHQWLLGNRSLKEVARDRGVSDRTLRRRFARAWMYLPPARPPVSLAGQALIVDGLYLARRACVLIARTPAQVVAWTFVDRESTETWSTFFAALPVPWAIVSDGQKGLRKAITVVWPLVLRQRCLAHILRLAQTKLTRTPKTDADRHLRRLILALARITLRTGRRGWLRRYRRWERQSADFLKERTIGHDPKRQRGWWYTHARLRSVRHLLRSALPDLFAFSDHPSISSTTNHLEGGLNSRLKELIQRHRGLSLAKKQALTACFLASKQRRKPPRNVR